ncbi:MAG: hypothetical protein A3E29_03635 [Candidatus Doudnabacteria bacterium RIFCSPHIGHO2_12_FULL_48_16]|uniref:LTD domain-containing protein n=1 Tax=Candidatus Doudnabacteria bacterium RIFCSPHIGHO2_12_FULL_48_16 TaxID=1817838 RepID=A0A1F5PJX3_9BACT|nr:MAG: hypothetical protein A3E29_03635 [Candidatus Doudnabacteria bacterium RIFCSPHIGHO2_12_FULL_48_16]
MKPIPRKICFIIGVLIFLPFLARADTDHLVISQIQITGGSGKTTNDFVEIYNPTSSDIDLKGYRLVKRTKTGTTDTALKSWTASTIVKAHGFYLWANSSFTDISAAPDTSTTGSIADDNAVALRNGANDTGAIIDSVAWGQATNAFVEGSAFAANPGTNQSLERLPGGEAGNGLDTNNNSTDFMEVSGHPRNSSATPTPALPLAPEPPPADPPADGLPASEATPPAETSGTSAPAPPLYSSAIVVSEFAPNPEGPDGGEEWVELYNDSSSEVDLSDWILDDAGQSGLVGSSAYVIPGQTKVAAKSFLVIDLLDGSFALNNTGGDTLRLMWPDKQELRLVAYKEPAKENETYARQDDGSFAWTSFVTKGAANQFGAGAVAPPVTAPAQLQIKFNEIFPNPAGSDSGGEWVEILNTGSEPVYLHNWILDDGASDQAIRSSAYKIQSPIVYPGGLAVIMIPAGRFALDNTGSETVRLFNENKILIDSVTFEAGKEGQSYALLAGQWIWIDPTPNAVNEARPEELEPVSSGLLISELYPEPSTSGQEFIELFNSGSQPLDLHGWQVADAASKYTFHSPIIEPGHYYVLLKSESNLALNNSGKETITVIDPAGQIISSLEYEDAPKNQSYNLLPDGTFAWSLLATPGELNQIKIASLGASGQVLGATLPRTGNDLPFTLWDGFVIWSIFWYIYIRLNRDPNLRMHPNITNSCS